jgi:hypothetical protein
MVMPKDRQEEQKERDEKPVPEADGMFPEERTGQFPEEHPQPVEGEGCGEEVLDFEPPASQAESSYPGDRAPDVVEGEQRDTEQEDEMSATEPTSQQEEKASSARLSTNLDDEQPKSPETVDEALDYIISLANRGTIKQFYIEVSARLSSDRAHDVALDGNTLIFYNVHEEGGILGIGARSVHEPALQLIQEGQMVIISDEPMDPDCAVAVAQMLARN